MVGEKCMWGWVGLGWIGGVSSCRWWVCESDRVSGHHSLLSPNPPPFQAHMSDGSTSKVAAATAVGVILAGVYSLSGGSLGAAIAVHACNNLVASVGWAVLLPGTIHDRRLDRVRRAAVAMHFWQARAVRGARLMLAYAGGVEQPLAADDPAVLRLVETVFAALPPGTETIPRDDPLLTEITLKVGAFGDGSMDRTIAGVGDEADRQAYQRALGLVVAEACFPAKGASRADLAAYIALASSSAAADAAACDALAKELLA